MMEQMELPLWETLRSAQMVPEQVDFEGLLAEVGEAISQVPESEQLRCAGDALLQLADLCAARADVVMSEWEAAYRDPIVGQGFFADVVRQTMAVDLSELMEPAPPRQPRTKQTKSREIGEGSIVAPVDKAVLLAMVEQLESEAAVEEARKQQVLAIAHAEDVLQWSEAIAQWLEAVPAHQASFAHLCQGLGMPPVEVWLGVLFGEFELEPGEEFYSDALWVKTAVVHPDAARVMGSLQCDACQNVARAN